MKAIYAATLLFTTLTHAEVTTIHIRPSATDPSIRTYDLPHDIYVNREIVVDKKPGLPEDRHELLLWIRGTHTKGTPYRNGAVASEHSFSHCGSGIARRICWELYPA